MAERADHPQGGPGGRVVVGRSGIGGGSRYDRPIAAPARVAVWRKGFGCDRGRRVGLCRSMIRCGQTGIMRKDWPAPVDGTLHLVYQPAPSTWRIGPDPPPGASAWTLRLAHQPAPSGIEKVLLAWLI